MSSGLSANFHPLVYIIDYALGMIMWTLIGKVAMNIFQKEDCVTISNIYRAKGNEAWKVYVCRFEYATIPLSWKKGENELHKRNEAFVALTRPRTWCVVTGQASPIFDELTQAISCYPNFNFTAFNKQSLKRITEDENNNDSKKHQLKLRLK